jgi:hypothetical protein
MVKFWRRIAMVAALFSVPAQAQTFSSTSAAIDAAAEATGLSEFCVNWAVDSIAVRRFLGSRNIRIAGDNRAIFGAAYARTHRAAWRGGNFPAACDRALDLYGPQGRYVAGLVRPVWHGACGDCQMGAAAVAAAH